MDALYRYLSRRAQGSAMTPQRFFQGGGGDVVISANPLAGVSQIDAGIMRALAAEIRDPARRSYPLGFRNGGGWCRRSRCSIGPAAPSSSRDAL